MTKKPKLFRPLKPDRFVEQKYRRALLKMVDDMHASVTYWLTVEYKRSTPEVAQLAQDVTPTQILGAAIRKLTARWRRNFRVMGKELAAHFAKSASRRTDAQLRAILKRGGFTVELQHSPAQRDILQATVQQNVSLIRSIPEKYLSDVEQMVMRSVQTGRDLKTLTDDLQKKYKVTRRRAELIARDQNNKVTSALERARQVELGITEAVWVHSHAGKVPRPSHVKMDGKKYDTSQGMWDADEKEWIFPGQLINCLPGSTQIELADFAEVAYRHWFSGELTEIVTESGKRLSLTPNHPVLTSKGWRPAQLLQLGDYVVDVSEDNVSVREKDIDDSPPTIAQIFDSFTAPKVEIAVGANFHGDLVEGEVNIKRSNGSLRFGKNSFLCQGKDQLALSVSHYSALGESLVSEFGEGSFGTTSGDVSVSSRLLALRDSEFAHADTVRVTDRSDCAAGTQDLLCDEGSRSPSLLGEFENTDTSLMLSSQLVRVVSIKRNHFTGHVYNLQTKHGWYIAQGLVTHNCRCFSRAIIPGLT